MTKHKIFIGAPTFIISKGVILEGSYAMAFGGVDTGNMKENDVVNVGGNINNKGLMDSDTHTKGVMIGNNMLAVALLEATCVSSMAMEQIISWRTKESKSVRPANCCPIQSFKPRKKNAIRPIQSITQKCWLVRAAAQNEAIKVLLRAAASFFMSHT